MTLLAPRIVNDVSYVTRINHEIHFALLFVAGAALGEILIDSRSAKCCIFPYKMRLQGGTRKVSEAAGAR